MNHSEMGVRIKFHVTVEERQYLNYEAWLSADDEQEKETNCLDTTGVGYSWFKSNKFIL